MKKQNSLEFKTSNLDIIWNLLFRISNFRNQSGQTSLVILLLLALTTTVALITTQNVTSDIQMTKVQEESIRAFSVAEAGIEQALHSWRVGETIPAEISFTTGKASVETVEVGEDESSFTFPSPAGKIDAGNFTVIWLTDHDGTGNPSLNGRYQGEKDLNICWQSEPGGDSALELILFYYLPASGEFKTKRWAFDPDGSRGNNFASAGVGCAGLPTGATINLPAGRPLFVVVKVYYQGTAALGAEASGVQTFPSQGKLITSTGEVLKGDQVVSRRLRVFQSWDLPPFVFLEPLFSGGSIEVSE